MFSKNVIKQEAQQKGKNTKSPNPIRSLEEFQERMRRHLGCPICLGIFRHPVSLICGHTFCSTCLVLDFQRCRGQIFKCCICKMDCHSLITVRNVRDIIEEVFPEQVKPLTFLEQLDVAEVKYAIKKSSTSMIQEKVVNANISVEFWLLLITAVSFFFTIVLFWYFRKS